MRYERAAPRRRTRDRFALVLMVAVGWTVLAVASPASAADIEFDAPAESTVGETVNVSATISDGGQPVADAVVAVTRRADFGGESGFVELDRDVTDEAGMASFEFLQYADSSDVEQLRIEYEGPDGVEAAEFEITVRPGPQQYVGSSGVDIGILNVSWLVVVIGLVWIILLVAVAQLLVISRARDESKRAERAVPYLMVGFVAFTAAGMFTVVLTQPTTHANLAPTEFFDRVPTAFLGGQYGYEGHGVHATTGRPDDLSGEVLYIQSACASCHGIGGRGATVGGELTDSMMSDTDEVVDAVRRGPKGMPAYSEQVLSEDEIERLIDYVLETNGE